MLLIQVHPNIRWCCCQVIPGKKNESGTTGYVTTCFIIFMEPEKKTCSSRLDHTTTILPSYLLEVASRKSKSLARSEAKIREYIQI
jgi:hypothetical protein